MKFLPDSIAAAQRKIAFIQRREFASFHDDIQVETHAAESRYSRFWERDFEVNSGESTCFR